MNIFFLHRSAPICAQMHADVHVVKMILESAQLLATTHHHYGNAVTYKPTHANHPCAVWVRQSRLHYMFLVDLALALCREYRLRFSKTHKCEDIILNELRLPPADLKISIWNDPPLAMPDEFKSDDLVESYQRYYASKNDKMTLRWFRGDRLPPFWFTLKLNEIEHAKKVAA
jgi:hypothetical protein